MAKPVMAVGWAARDRSGDLSRYEFSRRPTGERDVRLNVLYCGVCHSDLHTAKNNWGFTVYPVIPGHEIVGEVTEVGSEVNKFKVGDKVGVGVIVDSCRKCDQCTDDLENYCSDKVFTYGSVLPDGDVTQGVFSTFIVVDEHFVVQWPKNLPMDSGAPLLCAGITTYSPLRHFGLDRPGQHIGVVGLGGLGHVAVKFAKAFGAKVTVISTSVGKRDEALEKLGADAFVVSREAAEMQAAAAKLDGIIDTVSAVHPIAPLLRLLKPHGQLILVGLPEKRLELPVMELVMRRCKVAGSVIGSMKEMQEMIDFAAKHNILPNVEMISMDYVNTAMERLDKNDIKYRFVIDVANALKDE